MIAWSAAMRYSYSAQAYCAFVATLDDGRALVRHELTWKEKTPEEIAPLLLSYCREWKLPITVLLLNRECFPSTQEQGETISESFRRCLKMAVRPGHEDRVAGWARVRSWLQPRPEPSLLIHADCKRLIRTLPTLVSDEKEPDDLPSSPLEYPAYAIAMYCMSRPLPGPDQPRQDPPVGTWGHALRHMWGSRERQKLGADLVR